MSVEIQPGCVPSVAEYVRLRSAAGLSARSVEGAAIGLPATWFGVVARAGGEAVGMGRIVGDGGCFFLIVDIAVLPSYQGQGIGTRIMTALVAELKRRAPAGAYCTLIADGGAHRLYEKFGFEPTAPAAIGMFRTL